MYFPKRKTPVYKVLLHYSPQKNKSRPFLIPNTRGERGLGLTNKNNSKVKYFLKVIKINSYKGK